MQAIALVQMMENGKVCKEGEKRISQLLKEIMLRCHGEFLEKSREEISYEILSEVYTLIEKMSLEYHVGYRKFQAELLALSVDRETDTYCVVRLGNGIIMGTEDEKRAKMLSKGNSVSNLDNIVSPYAYQKLKVSRGMIGRLTEFQLCIGEQKTAVIRLE